MEGPVGAPSATGVLLPSPKLGSPLQSASPSFLGREVMGGGGRTEQQKNPTLWNKRDLNGWDEKQVSFFK